jgi:cell division protein FtsN
MNDETMPQGCESPSQMEVPNTRQPTSTEKLLKVIHSSRNEVPVPSTTKLSGNNHRLVIGTGLLTVIIILIFLWTSLYLHETIDLNVNRWLMPHVQVETRQQKAEKLPQVQAVQPLQSPLPSSVPSKAEATGEGKPSSLPQPKIEVLSTERDIPSSEVTEIKVIVWEPYSVQIIAQQKKDDAEAMSKQLRGRKFSVRVEEVDIKGKGRWYRVLLGKFKNRAEALKYLNDNKIGEIYPQSFIQKSAN